MEKLLNPTRLPYYLFIAVVLCCVSCHLQSDEVRVANYIYQQRMTTNQDSNGINSVLDTLLLNTPWQGKKQINRKYQSNLINVFIIDGSISFIHDDENISNL